MMIRTTFVLGLALTSAGAAAETIWRADGFDMPESVLFDPEENHLVVSEIRGGPGDLDGNGGLILMSPAGEVIDAAWTEGMNAPKGLALLGDRLLVADLDTLRVLDRATGGTVETFSPAGAEFFNDVTVLDGAAYITDLMTHTIWRFDGTELVPWLEDARLAHPNGILAREDDLIVGSWGAGLAADFSTETPGGLLSIDPESRQITELAPKLGNVDGIAPDGDTLLVSDWTTGDLIRVRPKAGTADNFAAFPSGLADISAADGVLYLPHMLKGEVEARTLK